MDLEDIKRMKKGELHVHLNGLVSTDVIQTIIQTECCDIPSDFCLNTDLKILSPKQSLADYLKPWQILRLVPKSRTSLRMIVQSAFSNLKADNIIFAEIRNSVIYIANLNKISIEEALSWLIEEIKFASLKYGVISGLVLTVSRGQHSYESLKLLLKAYGKIGCPDIVLGLDLAGNEEVASPEKIASLFKTAKTTYGLNITVHAGETGNYKNIKDAILDFGADRIGHGTAAPKSREVMKLLKEKNICVEVCPISNRLTRAIPGNEAHPVNSFIEHDIPFVICSDNPAIHSSCLSDDYYSFLIETGNEQHIREMYTKQKNYTFLKGFK